jgi:hypothetical protein
MRGVGEGNNKPNYDAALSEVTLLQKAELEGFMLLLLFMPKE